MASLNWFLSASYCRVSGTSADSGVKLGWLCPLASRYELIEVDRFETCAAKEAIDGPAWLAEIPLGDMVTDLFECVITESCDGDSVGCWLAISIEAPGT